MNDEFLDCMRNKWKMRNCTEEALVLLPLFQSNKRLAVVAFMEIVTNDVELAVYVLGMALVVAAVFLTPCLLLRLNIQRGLFHRINVGQ